MNEAVNPTTIKKLPPLKRRDMLEVSKYVKTQTRKSNTYRNRRVKHKTGFNSSRSRMLSDRRNINDRNALNAMSDMKLGVNR